MRSVWHHGQNTSTVIPQIVKIALAINKYCCVIAVPFRD